ncbi:hypothetical protein AAHC03_013663 [Spirometra sp. Aus1]
MDTSKKMQLLNKFYDMDKSGDGYLSKDELEECMKQSGLSSDKVKEFLSLFDGDGDGKVSLDEYEHALGLKDVPPSTQDQWVATFHEMDADNSGQLTAQEVYEGLKRSGVTCSLEDIKDLIASVDDDGSQTLNLKEFLNLMRLQ